MYKDTTSRHQIIAVSRQGEEGFTLVELVVSMVAAPEAVIETVSVVAPTVSVISTSRICATSTLTSSTVAALKPDFRTVTLYKPGFSCGKTYRPLSSVTALRVSAEP